jgi:hypothetical protein
MIFFGNMVIKAGEGYSWGLQGISSYYKDALKTRRQVPAI